MGIETPKISQGFSPEEHEEGPKRAVNKETKKKERGYRRNIVAMIKRTRRFDFEKIRRIQTKYGELSIGKSNLELLNSVHQIDFEKEIRRIFREKNGGKLKDKIEQVRVLDVGAGASTFLLQLRRLVGNRIEPHRLDIKPHEEQEGVMQHIFHAEGVSRIFVPGFFDIIVDNRGGMFYSVDRERALNEFYKVLAPGGTIYLDPRPRSNLKHLFEKDWLVRWAQERHAKLQFEKAQDRLWSALRVTKPLPEYNGQ